MHFDHLLAKVGAPEQAIQFPVSWCQGRTAFGGLSAALLYQAMKPRVDEQKQLRSMSVNFVGPLLADMDFHIQVEVLREGKSSAQLLARAIQQGETCVIAQACFASDRESAIRVPVSKQMTLSDVNAERCIPYQEGVMPAFFQHVALSPEQGNLPFTGAKTSHLGGWMRLKQTPDKVTDAHILALTDAWPPTMLQMFPGPAPASSMSWYIEFVTRPELAPDSWLGFEAITHHSNAGYGLEDGCIWSQNGELIALTRQTVALFA